MLLQSSFTSDSCLITPENHRRFRVARPNLAPMRLRGDDSWRGSPPPPAFEIGGADLRALQQLGAAAAQGDQAVDHDVAAVREAQRMVGVLLDDQHGEAVLPV